MGVVSAMLFIASCTNTVNRGHLKEDEAMARIKVGITTENQVRQELGSPSSESSFGPKTWYYVSSIYQNRAILAPRVIDQHTTEIAFNEEHVVSSIKEYSLADSKDVQIEQRITPSEGQHLGFFEQVFSNLGRFNKDKNSTDINHGHSSTGSAPTGYPGR